jgi:large subunit ribosomal protein L14
MIQQSSKILIIDNSGAKIGKCITVLGKKKVGKIGDTVVLTIKKVRANSKIKRSSIKKGLIVRTKFPVLRRDGSQICFNQNAAILLNNLNQPIGTRILGAVTEELRNKKFLKVLAIANRII